MNDKIIEEMARVICPNSNEWTCKACNWGRKPDCDAYKNAEKLINEGYRNCKDKVVLSKEEYQDLQEYKNIAEQRKFNLDYANVELRRLEFELQQARKETAKEILQSLLDFVNCEKINQGNSFEKIKETLIKVAKTYEVEVEE